MNNAYTIKIVSHQGEYIKDRYSLRGGFGLTEDDVIYQAMQNALNDEDYYGDQDQDYDEYPKAD